MLALCHSCLLSAGFLPLPDTLNGFDSENCHSSCAHWQSGYLSSGVVCHEHGKELLAWPW